MDLNKAKLSALKILSVQFFKADFFLLAGFLLAGFFVSAQDPASLLDEGKALERKYKDEEAFDKYKQAFTIQPSNIQAAMKCAEMSCVMSRSTESSIRKLAFINQGLAFAEAAYKVDTGNANTRYTVGLMYKYLAENEEKKDKATEYLKLWRTWAEKALAVDSLHPKASYLLGSWHLEVLTLGEVRKTTVKLLYGGVKEPSLQDAVRLMEWCKEKEPYFCPNFLDLAKLYNFNHNYEKAIQTLERLAKLPTRRSDDIAIKEEGKLLLQKLQ
jgi:tetratricopeptide (TPR) repeat protein